MTDDIATIREALDNLGNEGYSTVDGAAAFAALDRVKARLAEAEAKIERLTSRGIEDLRFSLEQAERERDRADELLGSWQTRCEHLERERDEAWELEDKMTERATGAEERLEQAKRERDELGVDLENESYRYEQARAEADRLREAHRLREALNEIVSLHNSGHSACFSDAADDYAETARAALADPQDEEKA